MGLIFFVIFGFVVGLIARALMPGDQKMGFIMTALLGIAGSFVGGFLASLISKQPITEFSTSGIIGSVIGALLLMVVVGAVSRRRA
ncbi:MAG: GlsB/YeaQ/YmgE family stress response membrane protein [Polyangiales bacterium]